MGHVELANRLKRCVFKKGTGHSELIIWQEPILAILLYLPYGYLWYGHHIDGYLTVCLLMVGLMCVCLWYG